MPKLILELRPDVCGSVSVGTVVVIRTVAECLEIPLAEAADYVSDCVFEGRSAEIPLRSPAAAERLVLRLAELESPLEPRARVVVDRAD